MVDDYGVLPEVEKALKNKAALHEKCKHIIEGAGHVMSTEKLEKAVPFADARPNTESRHYAAWQDKDISREPQVFVGRLGPKYGVLQNWDPLSCWRYFVDDKQLDLLATETSRYPLYLNGIKPPDWVQKRHRNKWPYKWVRDFAAKHSAASTDAYARHDIEKHLGILYLLAAAGKSGRSVREMYSSCEYRKTDWLKELCSREEFKLFLACLHAEDSAKPHRPNSVPKVGELLELFRQRCVLFFPEENLSYDEATAKYNGRMTVLKHMQSKYKPYDGIRVYALNGSTTKYLLNFKVDLRD
eukprot:SAG22_NODE_1503_length_4277_cov_18.029440_1_plen_298_part_10